jgi:hypothetical protein
MAWFLPAPVPSKTMSIMNYADTLLDRRAYSTDTNEYATGLNDENEWEENILDSEIGLDSLADDFLVGETDDDTYLYNETGYSRSRIE